MYTIDDDVKISNHNQWITWVSKGILFRYKAL